MRSLIQACSPVLTKRRPPSANARLHEAQRRAFDPQMIMRSFGSEVPGCDVLLPSMSLRRSQQLLLEYVCVPYTARNLACA